MLKHCTKLLLPGMIEYVAFVAALVDDPSMQEAHVKGVDEILKAFSAFFSSTPEDFRKPRSYFADQSVNVFSGPRTLGVILPTIALLLDPLRSTPLPAHTLAVSQLLSLATTAPAAFKEATGKMDSAAKDALETSVRQAIGAKGPIAGQSVAKPQISLRSF